MTTVARQADTEPLHFSFRGERLEPLLSGALFWPAQRALLVADLHLEKMSSFARTGQLLPPYDTKMTLDRLAHDITHSNAQTIICLGDSFHRDEGTGTLSPEDKNCLERLVKNSNWIWLAGNHDPKPHELGGICQADIQIDGLTLRHEPTAKSDGQIAGHLHPAARVHTGGRSARRPCFAYDENLLLLPAYGSSTGSLNVLSAPFHTLWSGQVPSVIMLGRERLYAVNSKRLVGG